MTAAATPAPGDAKKGKKRPKARARLSEMETQSVHAVTAGANMRNKPLIMKAADVGLAQKETGDMADGDESQTTEGKQEPEAAPSEGLQLSTAHKGLLLTGITDTIEKLTGLGEAVGAAAINEQAPVPEDVLLVLAGCSEAMASLVQQASPPPPPAPEAEPDAEDAAPPAEAEMSAKTDDEGAEVEKAGAMLSRKNRGIIESARDALNKLLDAADKEKADKTEKSDDVEPEPAEPTVAEQIDGALAPLLQRFELQAAEVAKAVAAKDAAAAAKDEQIAKMAAEACSSSPSNSIEPEGDDSPVQPGGVPYNLSEYHRQRAAQEDPS